MPSKSTGSMRIGKMYSLPRSSTIRERALRRYMQSAEFADDIRNFKASDIVGVESTILIPSTSSPLK